MTLIVKGKDREELSRGLFLDLIEKYNKVILDIGAGDAKGTLRDARNHENSLYVAIDSAYNSLEKSSKQAHRKKTRGGVDNLLCVYGNIKDSYQTFENLCDEVRVILPWGDLLTGIAELDKNILNSISSCAKIDGEITIIINGEIWKENLPKRLSHLGEITPDFFINNKDEFAKCGIKVTNSEIMSHGEVENLNTTWSAKLLSSRDHADFIKAKAVRV